MELSDSLTKPSPEAPQDRHTQTLGTRLRTLRTAWGWPQEQVASILRVDQASISFWERDRIVPSGSALVALAALFRTTIEALERGGGFVISAPPNSPESSEGEKGDRRSQVRDGARAVFLPTAPEGRVTVVDLGDGSLTAAQLSDAIINLGHYAKENRRVWIVVE